jgi:hypothetical protein
LTIPKRPNTDLTENDERLVSPRYFVLAQSIIAAASGYDSAVQSASGHFQARGEFPAGEGAA